MNGYNLLVVEDDESSRAVWNIIFSRRGWNVALAGSVAEGLAMLDPAPDFLILDLSLPDGNGTAILQRVREAKLKTRVAVTTGLSDSARIRAVGLLQPEAIFQKPFDIAGMWTEGELRRPDRETTLHDFDPTNPGGVVSSRSNDTQGNLSSRERRGLFG